MMDLLWIILLTFIFILTIKYVTCKRRLPPGPWNLPIVGYLPWLDPKVPYVTLTELSKKYGNIYGLYLGSVYTVVLSDAKLIRKVFNKDAAVGRAPLYLTHGIMKGRGLICAEGELWKDQRKFVHNTLRTIGASKLSQNKIQFFHLVTKHITEFIQFLKNQDNQIIIIDPLDPLRHSVGSVINEMVFGKSWSRNDKTWQWLQHLQEEGTKHIGVAGPLNFLPFLRFLPNFQKTIRFLLDGKNKTHEIYREIIKENKRSDNVIGAFINEKNKRSASEQERFYNDSQFCHLLADVFGASLDTTLTTLRWCLLYLAAHENSQNNLRTNLSTVLGQNMISLEHFSELPYLEATIAEVQRIRSVVPVGIPHGTTEQMEIDDFIIPNGTMVVPLQWAIHMDMKNWDDPFSFKPERFLNNNGQFFKPEFFIPFQIGKRMCVGEELARTLLYSYTATIVQHFHISCKDLNKIDLLGDCGITLTPKPHELIFQKLENIFL